MSKRSTKSTAAPGILNEVIDAPIDLSDAFNLVE